MQPTKHSDLIRLRLQMKWNLFK